MFTGLIEEIGTITNLNNSDISVKCNFANELKIGDSICVNGVCLTATTVNKNSFCANISPSSYNITNFRHKKIGDKVNLERAALATSRLDGHLVYGHVDATANIISIEQNFDFYNIYINIPKDFLTYVVPKGSIAVDGISLTIAEVSNSTVKIAIIPHTWEFTYLKYLKNGSIVNIEFDMIAKYIEKKLSIYDNKSKISMEFLEENGFL